MTSRRAISQAEVRRIALALPEAFESAHFDRPDFRVGNKIFATLRRERRAVIVKCDPADVAALVLADGETFWNEWHGRWLGVRLDLVSRRILRELLEDAWRLVAPRRLADTLRGG